MKEAVIAMIKSIPRGKVAAYGQIATLCGYPGAARQVVRILHSCSTKYGLPWHRVVRSSGEIALDPEAGGALQRSLLEAEGVVFGTNGRIDMKKYAIKD
ncbi:MAG: DNA methyltransferase [Candidatus Cloacimonetes bacterium HGW-Cloacimonetes-1]|jgi:methylated-DNA-protein-cysteine methyltransferase-like protein|nr:MAG: DNA methyltransferase [Candidatus Cloacimonetes bacterium HGW-Cloacimonetes-1]